MRAAAVDGTGLNGGFDLSLEDESISLGVDRPPGVSDNRARERALETQLGPRLVRGKGPVDRLVVDNADRSAPN